MEIELDQIKLGILDEPVGIMCSGGADSSLLLYLLLTHAKQTVHIFTGTCAVKKYSEAKHLQKVIEKCIELTGNNNIQQHTVFSSNRDFKIVETIADSYIKNGIVKLLYFATTCMPPEQIVANFTDKQTTEMLKPERDPNVQKPIFIENNTRYFPFINLNKQFIADNYKKFNLTESLFPLTRSCESFRYLDHHCGRCWWCQERFWAFNSYT